MHAEHIVNAIFIIIFLSFCHCSEGQFVKIAPGVLDEWNKANPENGRHDHFIARCSDKQLWLIGERTYNRGNDQPYVSPLHGGIVSRLDLISGIWSHHPFDRLDDQQRGTKIIALRNRLFALIYDINDLHLVFHKLFVWNDAQGFWQQTELINNGSVIAFNTSHENNRHNLVVAVPDQTVPTIYLAATRFRLGSIGGYRTEMLFAKLDIDFRSDIKMVACVKLIAVRLDESSLEVFCVFVGDNLLYALVRGFHSEGYTYGTGSAHIVNLNNGQMEIVELSGDIPSVFIRVSENAHQTSSEAVFVLGGGQRRRISDYVWINITFVLNLTGRQWINTNVQLQENDIRRKIMTFDQQTEKLYSISLKDGVKMTRLPDLLCNWNYTTYTRYNYTPNMYANQCIKSSAQKEHASFVPLLIMVIFFVLIF